MRQAAFHGNRRKNSELKLNGLFSVENTTDECASQMGFRYRLKCTKGARARRCNGLRGKPCADGAAGAREAVIDRAALIGREGRQGRGRVGFGGGELRAAGRAEGFPTLGEEKFGFGAAVAARRDIGGQCDGFGARGLAEQAAPFGEQAVNVAAPGECLRVDNAARGLVRGDNRGDDFARAETVAGRQGPHGDSRR